MNLSRLPLLLASASTAFSPLTTVINGGRKLIGGLLTAVLPGRAVIYATLIAFGLGAWSAHKIHTKLDSLAEASRQQDVLYRIRKITKEVRVVEQNYADQKAIDKKVEERVQNELRKLTTQGATINGCSPLTRGTVWLLDAISERGATVDSVSEAAARADAEGRTASEVTVEDLAVSHAKNSLQYNGLANKCDALIDWIEARDNAINSK